MMMPLWLMIGSSCRYITWLAQLVLLVRSWSEVIVAISSDRVFYGRHADIQLLVIGILMSIDPMLHDDVEQCSRLEDVQQWSEYRALWNAEQHRRRNRLLVAAQDLLCASTEKRPDPVERSFPMPTTTCRRWSRIRWSTQSNAANMSSRLTSVTYRSSATISMSDQCSCRRCLGLVSLEALWQLRVSLSQAADPAEETRSLFEWRTAEVYLWIPVIWK